MISDNFQFRDLQASVIAHLTFIWILVLVDHFGLDVTIMWLESLTELTQNTSCYIVGMET